MIFDKHEKKRKGKKTTAAALAVMLGVTVVPFTSIETALAAANPVVTESEGEVESRPTYDSVFKIARENIVSFTNNGGKYGNSVLSNMFDGDTNTHWETGKRNNGTFKNHVIVTFDKVVELGEVVYYPRVQGAPNKGFPTKFSIYASLTDEGDDFELVQNGSATASSGALKIKLKEHTDFKRLKFVFDESHLDWSAGAELAFYKPDILSEKSDGLFTDGTMSKVNPSVTLTEVNEMLEQAKMHPSTHVTEKLQLAKDILQGKNVAQEVFAVEQRGDGVAHARNTLQTMSYGSNLLPTGIAALAGEQIKVYVDAEEGKPLPKITFSQQVGHWSGWQRTFDLKQGENIFTVPTMHNANWAHKVIPGGAIYLVNPYTPEQQGEAPRIRIEGGHDYPLFKDGDNVDTFMQELADYKEKLTNEPNKYVDIVELVNDYTIINSNMLSAESIFVKTNQTPQGTLNFHADRLGKFFAYAGLSEEERNGSRANLRLMQPWAAAYASGDHTGFQQGSATTLFGGSIYGWAIAHELGHHFDHQVGKIAEVTNNMWANYNRVDLQNEDDKVEGSYETIFTKLASDDYKAMEYSVNSLGVWWQLHLLNEDYWPNYQKAYRAGIAGDSDLSKNERMVAVSSYAMGMDVTEHFERHKFINEESAEKIRAVLEELEVPKADENIKPWYMWTKATKDRESEFKADYKPEVVSVKSTNGKVEIKVNMDESAQNALLGYEIIRDGKVLGFTRTNTFTSAVEDDGEAHEYKVRAFDLRSNATEYSESVLVDLSKPTISVVKNTIVPVNSENFDLSSLVVAHNVNGEVLDGVTVSGEVDTTTIGDYKVTYSVTDEAGKTTNADVTINVVSDAKYISDLTPVSSVVGWSTMKKDRGVNGNPIRLLQNGAEQVYEKGIGVHANSKVVYNVEGENYEYFESFIGIDGEVRTNTKPSAIFEVWVDGVKKFESSVMDAKTEQAYAKVDIKGAKEVVLITNGNGKTDADHTVWADAKFATANSAPTIKAEGAVFEKGEEVNLKALASATDKEDGDLEVTYETDYQPGSLGEFDVTYTAMDTAGNKVSKTIQIFVSDLTAYVSDTEWKSAVVGWGQPMKDVNIENNRISLLVDGERKYFDKGIGAHATSTIVYDLDSMKEKPRYFSSFVGVDYSKPSGNVIFKVYADGELVASTGALTPTDEAKFLNVNLKDVSELKLVADSNGSNSVDHAVWADSKFHYIKSKEQIERENLTEATDVINQITDTLKAVLTTEDVSQIEEILVAQPAASGFSGNETEERIVAQLTEALEGRFNGQFSVYVTNYNSEYTTVDELLQNNLIISYQASEDKSWYILQNGEIAKRAE